MLSPRLDTTLYGIHRVEMQAVQATDQHIVPLHRYTSWHSTIVCLHFKDIFCVPKIFIVGQLPDTTADEQLDPVQQQPCWRAKPRRVRRSFPFLLRTFDGTLHHLFDITFPWFFLSYLHQFIESASFSLLYFDCLELWAAQSRSPVRSFLTVPITSRPQTRHHPHHEHESLSGSSVDSSSTVNFCRPFLLWAATSSFWVIRRRPVCKLATPEAPLRGNKPSKFSTTLPKHPS